MKVDRALKLKAQANGETLMLHFDTGNSTAGLFYQYYEKHKTEFESIGKKKKNNRWRIQSCRYKRYITFAFIRYGDWRCNRPLKKPRSGYYPPTASRPKMTETSAWI